MGFKKISKLYLKYFLRSTDFEEDETTFRRVVGAKFATTHLTGPRKTWNMAAIYEHIILDRLLLDMTPRESKQQLKPAEGGGRRAGLEYITGFSHSSEI